MARYHIYADESRPSAHPLMLYGMIIIPPDTSLQRMVDEVSSIRAKHKFGMDELKWDYMSRQKVDLVKAVIDQFFAFGDALFRCMSLERSAIDCRKHHGGEHENAFYWGYGMAISRNLEIDNEYEVFLDHRINQRPNRFDDLRSVINAHWIQEQLARHVRPREVVRTLRPVDSKDHCILQVADVLLGAVGYALEGRHEMPGASRAKIEIKKHIESCIGCQELSTHHGMGTCFNIWKFRFRTEEELRAREEKKRAGTDP